MIEISDVFFKYDYAVGPVFDGLTLSLDEGVSTVLCDDLSGKTTLCKLILGLKTIQKGKIAVDGIAPSEFSRQNLSILYLPRQPLLLENKSVLKNLAYPLRVRKVKRKDAFSLAKQVAHEFGLDGVLQVKAKKLGRETRNTLVLARGKMRKVDVVLDDGFGEQSGLTCESLSKLFATAKYFVTLTSNVNLAIGQTAVIDGGKCVYQGDTVGAKEKLSQLCWINNLEK